MALFWGDVIWPWQKAVDPVVTSSVWSHLFSASPGPDVHPSITNYRLRLTFSSWAGEGGEGAVTPGYFILPWWQEAQTVLAPVWQGPGLIAGNLVHQQRSPRTERPLEVYLRCTGPPTCAGQANWRCPVPQNTGIPLSWGRAAETGACPAPRPHPVAPSACCAFVLLPLNQPSLCSGMVQFMNVTLNLRDTGLGGKSGN